MNGMPVPQWYRKNAINWYCSLIGSTLIWFNLSTISFVQNQASDETGQGQAPPLLTIEPAKPQAPLHEHLQFLAKSPPAPAGRLLYITPVYDTLRSEWERYIVLRTLDSAVKPFPKSTSKLASFKTIEGVIGVQFSPDGHRVLIQFGARGDSYSAYYIYFWNPTTNELEAGPNAAITYQRVYWSPDSRHIAYILGGDMEGGVRREGDRLKLYIYNLQTHRSQLVAEDAAVTSLAWTQQNSLLFSQLSSAASPPKPRVGSTPKSTTQEIPIPQRNDAATMARPSLYEIVPDGHKAQLVLSDGYRPAPSPDGKWIACITSTDPARQLAPTVPFNLDLPRQSYLCLYNRMTKQRLMVQPEGETFSVVRWSPDSQHLIIMQTDYKHTEGTAHISIIDVPSLSHREVTILRAKDSEAISRSPVQPQFELLAVTKNGRNLLVKVQEVASLGTQLVGHYTLLSTNLLDGSNIPLCKFVSVPSFDWFDDP